MAQKCQQSTADLLKYDLAKTKFKIVVHRNRSEAAHYASRLHITIVAPFPHLSAPLTHLAPLGKNTVKDM